MGRSCAASVGVLAIVCVACGTSGAGGTSGAPAGTTGSGAATAACGTPEAPTRCESATWPRVVVALGSGAARSMSLLWRSQDGRVEQERTPCPAGLGESSALHCDVSWYGVPGVTEVTLEAYVGDGGAALASLVVPLQPFNYCGVGIAQVLARSDADAGVALELAGYVDACGL